MQLENEIKKDQKTSLTPTKVYQTAIRLLARREHSVFELKQKLLQREFAANTIEEVTQKLMDQNLLSDERYVEIYIRSRAAKGYGPIRIASELQQQQINKELITHGLKNPETNWQQILEQTRRKKFGLVAPNDSKEWAKQIRYLQYKGFSLEQIRLVLSNNFKR